MLRLPGDVGTSRILSGQQPAQNCHEKTIAVRGLAWTFRPVSRRCSLLIVALAWVSGAVAAPLQIRIATFNSSLNRGSLGALASDLAVTTNNQAKRIAEIIQRVRPDILLVNEFDYDSANPTLALDRFHNNYLAVSQGGQPVLSYPYRYVAPSNTGVPTGKTLASEGDFDNNGSVTTTPGSNNYGNDCYGFGLFPGQYSFAVYSKYPIQTAAIRSFQLFKWKDMPGNVIPPGFYTAAELNIFRLSSKNHVDLPIEVKPGHVLHFLASHPTPPAFDGAEDRNGRRNRDEIKLWADYISNASYLRDDAGVAGGLAGEQRFVILGDLNADPLDGDSYLAAINQLRNHALVNSTPNPSSAGGTQQAAAQGPPSSTHLGNSAYDTSDFSEFSAGNLRVDHVLPSKLGFGVTGSGVFWPLSNDPLYALL
ncbi:MAG: endonuclease/exonuclease/phosphatase family protein, partial [Chthoniobacteraceae bacterium]